MPRPAAPLLGQLHDPALSAAHDSGAEPAAADARLHGDQVRVARISWLPGGVPGDASSTRNGRFGLVGMHIVQKTQTHGEWIWASFEHVANDPDCYPGGDLATIAAQSPIGTRVVVLQSCARRPVGDEHQDVRGRRHRAAMQRQPEILSISQHIFLYQSRSMSAARDPVAAGAGNSQVNCTSVPPMARRCKAPAAPATSPA